MDSACSAVLKQSQKLQMKQLQLGPVTELY